MIIFRAHFCKSEVRVPFCIYISFILSFNFEKNGNKMKWKMIEKWTKKANCERPYCRPFDAQELDVLIISMIR